MATNGNGTVDAATQEQIEEVLREAKTKPAEPAPQPEKKKKGGAIAKASDAVASKTAEQAQKLVKADQAAKEARLRMGMQEGLKDAQDIEQGYQLGLLTGVGNAKVRNTVDLSEQLKLLREHTDCEVGTDLSLDDSLEGGEDFDPTPLQLLSLNSQSSTKLSKKGGLQILPSDD